MIKSVLIDSNTERGEEFKKNLINEYSSFSRVYSFANKKNGFQVLERERIDVLFLHIEKESLELYEWLGHLERDSVQVIILTEDPEVILSGLRLRVTDILLLPIVDLDLSYCIQQIECSVLKKREQDLIFHSINVNGLKQNESMFIKTTKSYIHIWMNKMTRLEADGNYTYIFLNDKKKILTSNHLKKYEDVLYKYNFYRVNKSFLVNLHFVRFYHRGKTPTIEMEDGFITEVSRRLKKDLIKRLEMITSHTF